MLKYILGLLKNLNKNRVSLFALIDYKSNISYKAKINFGVKIFDSIIDDYSYVAPKTEIICADIGKFCSIASYVCIGPSNHSIKNISTSPIFTSKSNATGYKWTNCSTFNENLRTSLGNDVWIGTKVIILGGTKIGDGAVIGAGSIVTKDIPAYSIAVGVPAKVIKYRFNPSTIDFLVNLKWWNMDTAYLKNRIQIFQTENISLDELKKYLTDFPLSEKG